MDQMLLDISSGWKRTVGRRVSASQRRLSGLIRGAGEEFPPGARSKKKISEFWDNYGGLVQHSSIVISGLGFPRGKRCFLCGLCINVGEKPH